MIYEVIRPDATMSHVKNLGSPAEQQNLFSLKL